MDGPTTLSRAPPRPQTLGRHATETLQLAAPLAVAQLAQMAIGVTDTVLLGSLGEHALAAGGLGAMLFITVLVLLQGALTAVSVLVAQSRGAGQDAAVPGLYWTGMLLTVLLMLPAFALFSATEPLLAWLGQPEQLARDTAAYLHVLRWAMPGGLLGIGLMRAFLPAVGHGGLILWVSLAAAGANGVACYGLIHGAWGLPALGLLGAAWATVLVMTGMAATLLALVHMRPVLRPFVAWRRPDVATLAAMLRLGLPVTGTFAVETGLFLAVALLMGLLSPASLAAHQIAMSLVSVSFMVPLAVAQAANVRVGYSVGAADPAGARRAGLVAIGLGALFEVVAALVLLAMPGVLVGWYIDDSLPANQATVAVALALLAIAPVFIVADGVQCVAGGALRGLGDTRVPFLLAAAGYWGVGFPAAWWLAMPMGWGARGAWWGLAASLFVVAALLTGRFIRRSGSALRP